MNRIAPEKFSPLFEGFLRIAEEAGLLAGYRVLDGGVLIALNGVWYHTSEKINCKRCLHITKDGETAYYPSGLAGTIVKRGETSVLPVMAEMIDGDGEKKQDCEFAAAKRWLQSHGRSMDG